MKTRTLTLRFWIGALWWFGALPHAFQGHAAPLPPDVQGILEACAKARPTPEQVRRLNALLDRKDEAMRAAFEAAARELGARHGTPQFFESLALEMDLQIKRRAEAIARSVAADMGDGVQAVVRTGSSGDFHMYDGGKRDGIGRYRLLHSDDDISFMGPRGSEAAAEFNRRCQEAGLGNTRVKGFPLDLGEPTSYDILVKQLRDPDSFVGAAGFGPIRGEMLEKGGAVIASRQGGTLVPGAELLTDYVKRNPGGSLADMFDLQKISADLKRYGPLTASGSIARQLKSGNLSAREQVKQLLRLHAAMEVSGAAGEAGDLMRQLSGGADHFRAMGDRLHEAYQIGTEEAARQFLNRFHIDDLQGDCLEAALIATSQRLRSAVASAERRAGTRMVNVLQDEALKRLVHEYAAGFALLHDVGGEARFRQAMRALTEHAPDDASRSFYQKILQTAFEDARTLLREGAADGTRLTGHVADYVGSFANARHPMVLNQALYQAGPSGRAQRRRLLALGGERMDGKAAAGAREAAKLVEQTHGDTFLWRMLSSETGQKFVGEAIANAPFVLMTMYSEWQAGTMKDMSDAAFILLDFVPAGAQSKRALCEGMSPSVVLGFAKEALYFTPAWPVVLAGDVLAMSWTVSEAFQLENEEEGLVDILVYNSRFVPEGDRYRFVSLNTLDGVAHDEADLPRWFLDTRAVQLRHAIPGKSYLVNNLSERFLHLYNQQFVPNDATLQQMREAAQQQLDAIQWDEAARYFASGDLPAGMATYTAYLAGFDVITSRPEYRNANWARLFVYLKEQMESRKRDIITKVMVPQLIRLAEERYRLLHAEEDVEPKLDELQKQLESLRERPLGVTLSREVARRAKELADRRDTLLGPVDGEQVKRETRGRYWEQALSAYQAILDEAKAIPTGMERRVCLRMPPLQFDWTGDFVEDQARAARSKQGYALDLGRAVRDVNKIKGSAPDCEDPIDAQALEILSTVLLPWRAILDGQNRETPGESGLFDREYAEALEKVRALYGARRNFDELLRVGARLDLTPSPVNLGETARATVRFTDPELRTLFEKDELFLEWRVSPPARVHGSTRGPQITLSSGSPLPVRIDLAVTRLGPNRTRGSLHATLPIVLPDDFASLTFAPESPSEGQTITFAVRQNRTSSHRLMGLHYRWRAENISLSADDAAQCPGVAGSAGPARVSVELLMDTPDGWVSIRELSRELEIRPASNALLVIDGPTQVTRGNPVQLRVRSSAPGDQPRFEWTLEGRLVGIGPVCDLRRLSSGTWSVRVRAEFADGRPPVSAEHRITVVAPSQAEFRLAVRGPRQVEVGDPLILTAVVQAQNEAAEKMVSNTWTEWWYGDTLLTRGDRLNLDTSSEGVFRIDLQLKQESRGGERLLGHVEYEVRIIPRREQPTPTPTPTPKVRPPEPTPTPLPTSATPRATPVSHPTATPRATPASRPTATPPAKPAQATATPMPAATPVDPSKPRIVTPAITTPGTSFTATVELPSSLQGKAVKFRWSGPRITGLPPGGFDGPSIQCNTLPLDNFAEEGANRPPEARWIRVEMFDASGKSLGEVPGEFKTTRVRLGSAVSGTWNGAPHRRGFSADIRPMEPIPESQRGHSGHARAEWADGGPRSEAEVLEKIAGEKGELKPIAFDGFTGFVKEVPMKYDPGTAGMMGYRNASYSRSASGYVFKHNMSAKVSLWGSARGHWDHSDNAWAEARAQAIYDQAWSLITGLTLQGGVGATGPLPDQPGAAATATPTPSAPRTCTVNLTKLTPAGTNLPMGGSVQLRATTSGTHPGPFHFQWQPHPEVNFSPFEGSPTTTATFREPGSYKLWVQVLGADEKGNRSTLAESEQIEINVGGLEMDLKAAPTSTQVGERSTVTATLRPDPGAEAVKLLWETKGGRTLNAGPEGDRGYSLFHADLTPVDVTVQARSREGNHLLASADIRLTASPYTVDITPPRRLGPPPRVWDPRLKQVVDKPQDIGPHQEFTVSARVRPTPTGTLRFEWTVVPEGCRVFSPGSAETRGSASAPGRFTLRVRVRNQENVELGSAETQVTVIDTLKPAGSSSPTPPGPDRAKAEAAVERAKAAEIARDFPAARNAYQEALRAFPHFPPAVQGLNVIDTLDRTWNDVRRFQNTLRSELAANRPWAGEEAASSMERFERTLPGPASPESTALLAKYRQMLAEYQAHSQEGKKACGTALQSGDAAGARSALDRMRSRPLAPHDQQYVTAMDDQIQRLEQTQKKADIAKKADLLKWEAWGHENVGDYAGAAELLQQSHALVPDPALEARIRDLKQKKAPHRPPPAQQKPAPPPEHNPFLGTWVESNHDVTATVVFVERAGAVIAEITIELWGKRETEQRRCSISGRQITVVAQEGETIVLHLSPDGRTLTGTDEDGEPVTLRKR